MSDNKHLLTYLLTYLQCFEARVCDDGVWWCSGGTALTVIGNNVDAAAQSFISVTVVLTRFSDKQQQQSSTQLFSVTSHVLCTLSVRYVYNYCT